jgi:hypothetical protein
MARSMDLETKFLTGTAGALLLHYRRGKQTTSYREKNASASKENTLNTLTCQNGYNYVLSLAMCNRSRSALIKEATTMADRDSD